MVEKNASAFGPSYEQQSDPKLYHNINMANAFIPGWLMIWLVASSLIVIYDASYVLQRPASMEGGPLFHIYSPYALYIQFDTLYGNLKDSFVVIQSWLNLVEVTLALSAVLLSFSSCSVKQLISGLIVVVGSAFIFWKTVIYLWYDHQFLTPATNVPTIQALFVFWIPSSLWIIFPLLTVVTVSKNIVKHVNDPSGKVKKA